MTFMAFLLSRILTAFALAAGLFAAPVAARDGAPVVLAAASLQESLNAAADRWAEMGHVRPVLSFAGTSALARQIEQGAPADLFLSADEAWMDAIERKGLIVRRSRKTFLGNRLVLVVPAARTGTISLRKGVPLAHSIGKDRLAMADVRSVPAGRYGKAALTALGMWDGVAPNVVQAENVRAALALVERGAAGFGVVYATDARASKGVRVAGVFPDSSHPPISYPIARLKRSRSVEGELFRRFLISARGKAIFARYGFSPR